ncbi:hypothetical protein I5L83_02455 [Pseudomonas aeruginosa]|nr:hypothetical protein [Pseudomonas aeruginosa]
MTSIDWSIAPHWAQAVVTTEHGNDMYWVEGWGCRISKRQRVGNLRPDFNTCDMTKLGHVWRLVERRPMADEAKEPVMQWNGQDGLPPVGVECEYRHMIWPEYRRCEIRYISDESLVAYDNGQEQYYRTHDMLFRPLPTPEQIAAQAVDAMLSDYQYKVGSCTHMLTREQAERLYAVGYRKLPSS